MGSNSGWVKIHRSIKDCDMWDDKPFAKGQAWIDLLLMANHEDKEVMFDGKMYLVKRGQCITSIRKLSEAWGWSRKKVSCFLRGQQKSHKTVSKGDTKGTLITIVNYDKYQIMGDTKGDTKEPLKGTQMHTNNKYKEIKNINKKEVDKPQRVFVPPTLEEVTAYCKERNNGIDAQAFIDFYSSKGWMIGKNKMKDWKAAVRTWERRGTKQSKIEIDTKFRDFLDQNQVVDFNT